MTLWYFRFTLLFCLIFWCIFWRMFLPLTNWYNWNLIFNRSNWSNNSFTYTFRSVIFPIIRLFWFTFLIIVNVTITYVHWIIILVQFNRTSIKNLLLFLNKFLAVLVSNHSENLILIIKISIRIWSNCHLRTRFS